MSLWEDSRPDIKIPNDEEIENETFKVMLTDDNYMNLPDFYVKEIVKKVFHNLISSQQKN